MQSNTTDSKIDRENKQTTYCHQPSIVPTRSTKLYDTMITKDIIHSLKKKEGG
jgi:hypothetical protein